MQSVVELELWTQPRSSGHVLDGKVIAGQCHAATAVPPAVVLGLNFVPDGTDVENVARGLKAGEFTRTEFQKFCVQEQLHGDLHSHVTAARFLLYVWGQPLAWLHFPTGAEGFEMALKVSAWADSRSYSVKAGQGEPALTIPQIVSLWDANA